MKKNIFVILFAVFVSFTVMPDEYSLFTGNAYTYNDVSKSLDKTQFLIKYDDSAMFEYSGGYFTGIGGTYYLFTEDWPEKIWIYLSENDLQTIRNAIIKYQDWVKLAKEKQLEIDKKIPGLMIKTYVSWKLFDKWYYASGLILEFTVLSQNPQRHELVITSNKVTPDDNSFIDVELNPLYFEEKEAADFLSCLDESNITKKKEEYNKKKEMQDLFN